ncbi:MULTISPECIES: DNA internalization-related competence protein ComEC/Rec2 [unclassified Variovorax]|uniref:DNA internalization-related competence protein ComEC/Rec2 n=1 Tax=unclassified Variovorax TaxID=663243 RepID=UPI003F45527F
MLWPAWLYAALLLAAVAGLSWRRLPARSLVTMAFVCGAMAGAGLAGSRAAAYAQGALRPGLEGRDLLVTGVVAEMPQRNEGGARFRLDAESARWADRIEGAAPVVPDCIALGWYAEDLADAPHAGERWRFTVRLKAPHGNRNPHGFDGELWMWEQGLHASGYVRTGARDEPPVLLSATWRHPVERAREAVRDAVFERVPDRGQAGVIAALVTGDQSAIDRAGWDVFRATGVAHLMSISGLHITMFAWLAAHVVGWLWRRSTRLMLRVPAPQAALVGGLLLAALYALFSGWGVPSQRTVWMLATVALLRLTGRRWPWPHVWLLTAAVVVAADPWALMQAGFWLSFVAVGVLFATDAAVPGEKKTNASSRLFQFLREQWVITLAITPLGLLLFQQVSLVGLLANAVAIPWVTLVVTPLAMLGVTVAPLWDLGAQAVRWLTMLLQWLAGLPYATLSVAAPPVWMAAFGVAGGALLAMRLPWSLRALGVPLLLPVLLWQAPRPATGDFELLAADIGQGNAVLVRTATHSLLYDAGPRYSLESDAGHRVLVPLLRAHGERLDMLVLSHRDSDHTGGAPAVLAMQPQAALLSSIEATHPLQALRPAQRCEAGQRWVWDGVSFEVLHPFDTDYRSFTKPNAVSCVLRIGNGHATALLAGDIERLQEAALVARTPDLLRADVLLAPHHGSKTSSSAPFLDAVRPRIALVQAGYRNRFGHPAPEVLDRYAQRGVRLVENTRCGAALWSSDRPAEVRCERDRRARYWQHRLP